MLRERPPRANIGPAKTKVWNSPRSPQGSTRGGQLVEERFVEECARRSGVELARIDADEMRAQAGGDHLARSWSVGMCQQGNRGSRPVPASLASR